MIIILMGRVKTIIMRSMCVLRKTLCPTGKRCKWRYFLFHRKRLEPRVLPWQQHSRCHFISFVMYFSGAKLEEHCSNISGDFLYSVLYCSSVIIYNIITFHICIIQKTCLCLKRKKIFQKGKHHSSLL